MLCLQTRLFSIVLALPVVTAWKAPPASCFTENPTDISVKPYLDDLLNNEGTGFAAACDDAPVGDHGRTTGSPPVFMAVYNMSSGDNSVEVDCRYVYIAIAP